ASTMYFSDNNGAYWSRIEIDNPLVHTSTPFLLIPTRGKFNGQVFAGTNWGVYRTLNDGIDWERVVPVGSNFQVNSFTVSYRGDMYAAASDSAVYKSTDEGLHWNKVGVTDDKVLSLAITPNGVLFAATYGRGVYRSLDDGASWHSLNSGLENELMLSLVYAEAGEKSTYIYAGGTGLGTFISRNSTTPFSLNRYDLLFPDVKVGMSHTDSIMVTNMDTTWLTIGSVEPSNEYYTVTPSETTLAIGESAWFYVTFSPDWYGTYNANVEFRSSANSSPDEVLLYGIGRAADTKLIYTNTLAYGRVLLGHFSDMSTRLKNVGNDTLKISSMYTTDSVFTITTDNTVVLPGEYALITVRFTPQYHGPYVGHAVIESNSMVSPDTIWLNGFGRGYPVPFMNVSQVNFGNVKIGKQKDSLFTLTNIGVDTLWISKFESNNSQFSVKIDKSPLPPGGYRTFTIIFTPFAKGETFGTLYLHSNSLSSPDSIQVHGLGDPNTDILTLEGVPSRFILYQNYPNPFNPSTTIRFALPEEGGVKISLFDMLGNEVAIVVEEVLPAGFYETHWRNSGLPSGVYFYRLTVKSVRPADDPEPNPPVLRLFEEMKKLILVK
ncbi:MAG: choice-of-anchor D domain-containing protein, partial [Bacteroidetes bacterium]